MIRGVHLVVVVFTRLILLWNRVEEVVLTLILCLLSMNGARDTITKKVKIITCTASYLITKVISFSSVVWFRPLLWTAWVTLTKWFQLIYTHHVLLTKFYAFMCVMQWPPLVEVVDTWELPPVLIERYNTAGGEGTALCGIFPEIRRAWASVDNSLFLWRFDKWWELLCSVALDMNILTPFQLINDRCAYYVIDPKKCWLRKFLTSFN